MRSAQSAGPVILDLQWLGRPRRIGAWRLGDVLIDCGPATCLHRLLEACGDWRPRALMLTHVHFDHAGAAGELVARWPGLQIFVHRRGARHLISPERLENSARRVFGTAFDERFGALTPVPEANVLPLDGGETIHGLRTMATPGHASHHLAFLAESSGWAFPGDVAGVRLQETGPVLLPTPPPDIDLTLWRESVDRIDAWGAAKLGLPHFGEVREPRSHLEEVRSALTRQRKLAERRVTRATYVATMRDELSLPVGVGDLDDLEIVVPLDQNHVGLERWVRRVEAGVAPKTPASCFADGY